MADVVKYGIQIPNRVFVGGVAFDTKEEELKEFFEQFGKIKECKIIKDNQSISRGFAFVTFECKHDAIQAQQKGTVFFNQKKLNLGPAIRQKGVVFNGAKEVGNEPVLSTGVYIHPSGYSYTVAPNGVWYFHNSDGTPPSSAPGAPPMAYTPTTMQKIQASQTSPTSTTSASRIDKSDDNVGNSSESLSTNVTSSNIPMYQTHGTVHESPPSLAIHSETQYQPPSYYQQSQNFGGSNIHVAFQNMSITTHPTNHHMQGNPIPGVPINMTPPPPQEHIPADMNRINYVNELYVPYIPSAKYGSPNPISNDSVMGNQRQVSYPVAPRAEYIPMINSSMYTVYSDSGMQQQYILPNYVEAPYCNQGPMINGKKAYYHSGQMGKTPANKGTNFLKNMSSQMHIQPQII